ncbi:YccF domain-containing protein [Vagococcus coleopterorum]|uniref:YccF domain-containing protein n=1 Tax=Vagococcus coleopterorum TaxID=2714946 RepID=A0A6G8ALQ0_9ENTE|nr:YccF domain-containing protein [Vagococcus coleopterorum]QIL45855.1 YccF domain-containing protein [Vagococcus coleopterorum]
MRLVGNIIWLIFGGLTGAIGWFLAGILWCITIIGIPVGLQCFKFAELSLWPFGKEIVTTSTGGTLILNIIWLLVSGIPLALAHFISGIILTITIVGIPFAKQSFKLATLALMPFGARIVKRY